MTRDLVLCFVEISKQTIYNTVLASRSQVPSCLGSIADGISALSSFDMGVLRVIDYYR